MSSIKFPTTSKWLIAASASLLAVSGGAQAALTTFAQSSLNSTNQLYTDIIGGGIGDVVVMTGGGNAAGVGNPSGRNDDGFSLQQFGFDFTFYGTTYSQFYANNNGNVSFTQGNAAYIPTGPIGASIPTISIWFGDVDTRNSLSDVLYLRKNQDEVILTWQEVGRFGSLGDQLNTFQMVIRGDDYEVPTGQGSIGFFWLDMEWERTNTSTTAAVGFGNGAGDAVVLEGSNESGLNSVVDHKYTWFTSDLTPVDPDPDPNPVPAPATLALLGIGALGLFSSRRRQRS